MGEILTGMEATADHQTGRPLLNDLDMRHRLDHRLDLPTTTIPTIKPTKTTKVMATTGPHKDDATATRQRSRRSQNPELTPES